MEGEKSFCTILDKLDEKNILFVTKKCLSTVIGTPNRMVTMFNPTKTFSDSETFKAHVCSGRWPLEELKKAAESAETTGKPFYLMSKGGLSNGGRYKYEVKKSGDGVTVGGVKLKKASITERNGIVYDIGSEKLDGITVSRDELPVRAPKGRKGSKGSTAKRSVRRARHGGASGSDDSDDSSSDQEGGMTGGANNRTPIINDFAIEQDLMGYELRDAIIRNYMKAYPLSKFPHKHTYSWPNALWSNFMNFCYENDDLGMGWLQNYLPIIGTDYFANVKMFMQPSSSDIDEYMVSDDILRQFTRSKNFMDKSISSSIKLTNKYMKNLPFTLTRGVGKSMPGVYLGGGDDEMTGGRNTSSQEILLIKEAIKNCNITKEIVDNYLGCKKMNTIGWIALGGANSAIYNDLSNILRSLNDAQQHINKQYTTRYDAQVGAINRLVDTNNIQTAIKNLRAIVDSTVELKKSVENDVRNAESAINIYKNNGMQIPQNEKQEIETLMSSMQIIYNWIMHEYERINFHNAEIERYIVQLQARLSGGPGAGTAGPSGGPGARYATAPGGPGARYATATAPAAAAPAPVGFVATPGGPGPVAPPVPRRIAAPKPSCKDPFVRFMIKAIFDYVYGFQPGNEYHLWTETMIAAGETSYMDDLINIKNTNKPMEVADIAHNILVALSQHATGPAIQSLMDYKTSGTKQEVLAREIFFRIHLAAALTQYLMVFSKDNSCMRDLLKLPLYKDCAGTVDRTDPDTYDGMVYSREFTLHINDCYNAVTFPGNKPSLSIFSIGVSQQRAFTTGIILLFLEKIRTANLGFVFIDKFSRAKCEEYTSFINHRFYNLVDTLLFQRKDLALVSAGKTYKRFIDLSNPENPDALVNCGDNIISSIYNVYTQLLNVIADDLKKDSGILRPDSTLNVMVGLFTTLVVMNNQKTFADHIRKLIVSDALFTESLVFTTANDLNDLLTKLGISSFFLGKFNVLNPLLRNQADNRIRGYNSHNSYQMPRPGQVPHYHIMGFYYDPSAHNNVVVDARKKWNQWFYEKLNPSFSEGAGKVLNLYSTAHMRNRMFFSNNYTALKPLHPEISHTMFYSDFMRFVGSNQTSTNSGMVDGIYNNLFPSNVIEGVSALLDPAKTDINVNVLNAFVQSPYMLYNPSKDLDKMPIPVDAHNPTNQYFGNLLA